VRAIPQLDLVLRADATPDIGAGHVMRAAALAEAWLGRGLGRAHVVGRVEIPFVRRRLCELGVDTSVEVPARPGEHVLLVDSYDDEVREACARRASSALRVLVDDLGERPPQGYDVVWNPNVYGNAGMYAPFGGHVITGPSAVPVREGLPRWSPVASGCTGVVVGGGSIAVPLQEALVRLATRTGVVSFAAAGDWAPSSWERIDASELWTGLARCDRLLVGSGTSVWEAAAVGIPVVVLQVAQNQRLNAEWVRRHGVPTIDATGVRGVDVIADAIAAALPRARPLPRLDGGASRVAAALHARAASGVPI